jgi:hypothetical protein
MALRVRVERAADLLLPLDHEFDADWWTAVPGAEGPDVGDHVRLRVRRTATEHRTVALARLERRRLPLRHVAGGDDVVVPVEQDRRRAGRRRDLTGDERSRLRDPVGVELLDARVLEEREDQLVRLEELQPRLLGVVRCGHRRDRDEPREILLQLRHERGDGVARVGRLRSRQ